MFLLLPIVALLTGFYVARGWLATAQALAYFGIGGGLWRLARRRECNP